MRCWQIRIEVQAPLWMLQQPTQIQNHIVKPMSIGNKQQNKDKDKDKKIIQK